MRISDWSSDVCSSDLRVGGGYVRLVADIAGPVLVRAQADVVYAWRVADEVLERLELQHLGAPPPMVGRDHAPINVIPVVEAEFRVEAIDAFPEIVLDALEDRKSTRLNSSH